MLEGPVLLQPGIVSCRQCFLALIPAWTRAPLRDAVNLGAEWAHHVGNSPNNYFCLYSSFQCLQLPATALTVHPFTSAPEISMVRPLASSFPLLSQAAKEALPSLFGTKAFGFWLLLSSFESSLTFYTRSGGARPHGSFPGEFSLVPAQWHHSCVPDVLLCCLGAFPTHSSPIFASSEYLSGVSSLPSIKNCDRGNARKSLLWDSWEIIVAW